MSKQSGFAVKRTGNKYDITVPGWHVGELTETQARELWIALDNALNVRCDYCGINPSIGQDDSGRPYCGDCETVFAWWMQGKAQ